MDSTSFNEGLILLKFSQNDKLCDMFFDKNKINIGIGEGESSIYSDGLFDLFIKLSIVKEKLEFYINRFISILKFQNCLNQLKTVKTIKTFNLTMSLIMLQT